MADDGFGAGNCQWRLPPPAGVDSGSFRTLRNLDPRPHGVDDRRAGSCDLPSDIDCDRMPAACADCSALVPRFLHEE